MAQYRFEFTHPDHDAPPFYGFTSAESVKEAREHLLQRAYEREEHYKRLNRDAEDKGQSPPRVVVPVAEMTLRVSEVKNG